MLTGGRSFRGAKDAELIREGAEYAVTEGETEGNGRESRIRIFIGGQPGGRKTRSARVHCRYLHQPGNSLLPPWEHHLDAGNPGQLRKPCHLGRGLYQRNNPYGSRRLR